MMNQGGWVQHQGTLKRLDLQALREYQLGCPKSDGEAISIDPTTSVYNMDNKDEEGSLEREEEEGYSIAPSFVVTQDDGTTTSTIASPLEKGEGNLRLLRQQLLFVHKPSGLHCVPSRDLLSDALSSQVATLYPDAKPCHRLDRDTSGIVLFGLTPDAHRSISKQFEARTTSKTYMALIAGHPSSTHGTINLPIGKQKMIEGFHRWTIGGEKPRESITQWRVDATFTDADTGATFSRVELMPLTGRGHQLRLHMKAIGCPILGDTIHGEGTGVARAAPRLCLHAQKLQVDWNGWRLEAESIVPF
jgi:tRNA pseudouridine32 synthase/23S rRNA pseudouridine746 synthase